MYSRGYLREHSNALNMLMRILDCTSVGISAMLAYLITSQPANLYATSSYIYTSLIAVLLTAILFPAFGLYQAWRGRSRAEEFRAALLALGFLFLSLSLIWFITHGQRYIAKEWVLAWLLGSIFLLVSSRLALRTALNLLRSYDINVRKIVVIGEGPSAQRVIDQLTKEKQTGFRITGVYSANGHNPRLTTPPGANVGTLEDAYAFLENQMPDQIWLALPLSESERIKDILTRLKDCPADVRLVPDIFGFHLINHSINDIAGLPVINLSVTPVDGFNRWIKAAEDKILAAVILIIISPLLTLLALGVKLSSPGPIFYRQERVSWNGKSFNMLKFRSMPTDAEAATGAVWAKPGEDRATPFGAFLRRTSLDELPQFINVLKGDMSIVGPRPERPVFVEKFKDEIPGYMQKHMVKAGITGWAQVNGWRGDTDLSKRIEHDLFYIENWSIWMDIKIIILTIFRGFFHKNAY